MIALPADIPYVPFHSQIHEIASPVWQQQGCGITSLAMLIDYYKPEVAVETLLKEGIAAKAFIPNAGWTYKGLISIAEKNGLTGSMYDFTKTDSKSALAKLTPLLNDGPVIASVHFKFDPKNPLPHMVVVEGIENGIVYYNDPAAKTGHGQITVAQFLAGWKKRGVIVRATTDNNTGGSIKKRVTSQASSEYLHPASNLHALSFTIAETSRTVA